MANPTLISYRNRAIILVVGLIGALRGDSELLNLKWEDIDFVSQGMIVNLRKAKTDNENVDQRVHIPLTNINICPVKALRDWQHQCKRFEGFIFCRLSKYGTIGHNRISLSYFNRFIKQIAAEVGLPDPDTYSSHSLRRGFATEAARRGATMNDIKNHGRWLDDKTVGEYIQEGRAFIDSAANVLFEK